ncbi:S-layer family protein [Commensalibacter papalotli (ex Botero et al. 2024)]|uniref:Autotransporter translocation and assembly protein TamB (TamB) (PDB:5VTG) n=1 Tax=Commensalibacter papalotli (ex Botero et al. 2024) TaxID=2972766 RepID=A0ABM9HU54_9PROT|nr:hemagglutinin repeat-containing protein [Commensalibacter papalotli (ex Botero et al. 2024)]CAI3954812.1 Autotransporter translocation and assembly protein TamB (TamB) (PDB:5VTG) [Commensalibacter papalotli (ex Botero et al. 2024)]CAI3955310.1 Autotransporter translocation and assembly protein TamB (TamB) (PDB:5VTG) [Commensalibacter papalotli (ex Botero et al. 2024)]
MESSLTFTVACFNKDLCRQLNPKDTSDWATPGFNAHKVIGGGDSRRYAWGSTAVNNGLGSTIVAGEDLNGDFSGEVNNTTIIKNASPDDFATDNRSPSSGTYGETTGGDQGKDGLTGPGNGDLSSSGSGLKTVDGKDNTLGYGGVIAPQGVDPGLHVTLPGFKGSGSTSINDILSSLTGGQALFRPNPNVNGGNSSLNGVTSGGITGGGSNTGTGSSGGASNVSNNTTVGIDGSPSVHSPTNSGDVVSQNNPTNTVTGTEVTVQNPVQSENINTSSVSSNSNYLIETRPQYTSVNEFYGSQYLLNRLDINGSYMFLGDAGFDTQYIQQQYIQATGQSYPGGTYMTASDAMKTLLNNASTESGKLGLQFGSALTSEQQAALDEDIVWYVPQVVDGQTVLVPQLYLSPKTDVLAGAAIKGKNVNITAGSIANSGLMEGTNSIALTATNGDISNIGGTIKGGNISLNAQNGSVINSDTVNNYLVNGGAGSYLGSQGQILASGTLGIQASDSIATHGGTIQSGSDLAMKAGTINIGSIELNAAASSVTHASDGTLSFVGNQTKNYGTTITAGGNVSLQSTSGDLTLSGSTLNATGNVSLSSAGNIGLNAVTDSGLDDVKGHKSGAFNSSSFENKYAYTNEVGSKITSGGQLNATAQNDISISGGLTAKNDVNVVAKEGSITENALTSTSDSYDYHHTKKTGFFGNETGLSAQVGTKKVTDKNSSSSVTHTGSVITSTEGSVNMSANKDININGSNILTKQDINLSGDNVNFNTVQDSTNSDVYKKQSFTGLNVGASGLVTDTSKAGFNITNATDTQGQAFATASGAYPLIQTGLGEAGVLGKGSLTNVNSNLIGVSASVGHSSNKSDTKVVTTTDVGSTVAAGGKVNVTAKNDINATASNISGNDVIFNAGGDVNLNAGYKTSDSEKTSSQNSFGVGASASIGIKGTPQASVTGNFNITDGNSTSSSKTAIDTVVNGTNSVTINNKNGSLNLNGAQITNKNADGTASDGSVTINTGNLNITTPQNTSKYDSTTVSGGLNASVPIVGDNYTNIQPNVGYTGIHNDYKSTEATMSGIYAGKGGLDVNVSGTTTMTGGAITSAADADKNQITTGNLVVNSLDNKDQWSGLNASGNMSFGVDYGLGDKKPSESKQTVLAPGSILGTAGIPALTSNSVSHDRTSTTESAIGDNITINTGSTTGTLSRDPDKANGHIDSTFNAGQINSDLSTQKTVGQLMGNYTNMAVEATGQSDNFKAGSIGKAGLDMAIGAGTAAMGGGNIGATVAGAAAGDAMNSVASDLAQSAADALFPQDKTLKQDHKKGVEQNAEVETDAKKQNPFNKQDQAIFIKNNKVPVQDATTDGNKIVNSLVQGLLTGGAGAAAGIITGNSGNIGVDTVNGAASAMGQSRPKVDDTDVTAAQAAQKPIRDKNYADAVKQAQNDYQNYTRDNPLLSSPEVQMIGNSGLTTKPSGTGNTQQQNVGSLIKLPAVSSITPKEVTSPLVNSPLQSVVKLPEIIQGQSLGGGL